ncbi:hypothetical protein [Limibacterium fermenti]|uniref:hypothetical protein n=1 Tax=Limibacterium fermenti TaxID=3229863 RepID=UPI003A6FF5F7
MKNRLIYSFLSLMILFLGYSCSSDNYLSDDEIQRMIDNSLNGQWQIVPITVEKEKWEWIEVPYKNEQKGYFRAIAELPELNQAIYEEGAILGYIFLGTQGKDEIQKTLPYIDTYILEDAQGNPLKDDKGNIIAYTERIDYDVQYSANGKSTVAFYIKTNLLEGYEEYLQDYHFRIVLIW